MNILAINGSPRRDRGTTEKVIQSILAEVKTLGHDTDIMYLADETPEYCTHCGHPCFSDGTCAREPGATRRSETIINAGALILGAPVYCWQPNALTCMLFDKFRIPEGTWINSSEPFIPAMGIAVAGGTGTGVFTALQSIYAWFCAWRFTPLDPVPVTRYNLDIVLASTAHLAEMLRLPDKPAFSGKWGQMLRYDEVPYMSYGRVDEFAWLATEMAKYMERTGRDKQALGTVRSLIEKGEQARIDGNTEKAAKSFMTAFDAAFPLCR